MANLSDIIEGFIKEMFEDIPEGILDIQRNEMANHFNCAPSQINYVLTTRFTLERGYFVESRRGGGGYIRIKKLKISEDEFLREIMDFIGETISKSLRESTSLCSSKTKAMVAQDCKGIPLFNLL